MLTRCPQCETIFRVSKKHISAAKGLVRCGSCKDIFNAKEHVIKSKKDLKKPVQVDKPETQINKPPKIKPNEVAERKSTLKNETVKTEPDSFDFVKDGFTSTGAYRKFDSTTPTAKAPQNKKPASKAEALERAKPTNFNFDSVFEDTAPKIPTKDVFIVKKPATPKQEETSAKITKKESAITPATFKAKTLQPHTVTKVAPTAEPEKKSNKASNFISQNVIEIKNVLSSISKKITNKVSNKLQQEKQSDEIVKKSLENKLNKSKLVSQNQAAPVISETKISTPSPVVNKAPKKPAVMSINSDTDIFSSSTGINKKSTNIEKIEKNTINSEPKLKKSTTPVLTKKKNITSTIKTSEPIVKSKPKLKEDAALKLAIQLKKAAQEKIKSTSNKKISPNTHSEPKKEQKISVESVTKKTKNEPLIEINNPVQPLIDINKPVKTAKPELNIINSSSTKSEPVKTDDTASKKQESEPKLQLVESEDLKQPKDKPDDKKSENKTEDQKTDTKKDSELIAKENAESIEDDDERIEGTDVHIHMQTTDIPMVLRESLEELDLPTRSIEMTLFMIVSLFFLVAGLLLQFTVFRSIEVQQNYPALKPLVTKVCKTFTCDYNGPREIKKIQLISRDIRVHPNTKGALLISATIINNAGYQQPYPNFSVKLSNLSGKTTAIRYFSPNDYLGKLSNKLLLMPPKQPIRIALEVVDPGKEAINFEFKFLSRK
jgi:predicted Zn finger-like uncharacterized protein